MTWEVSQDSLKTLLLGSQKFMVMALGSCVKWPLDTCRHKLARVHINIFETTEFKNIFELASHEI